MSVICVDDMAYVAFSAPDLDKMQRFLEPFGMTPASVQHDETLFMRGAGPAPFIHRTQIGDPGFFALGLRAKSLADLETLARHQEVNVEKAPEPGGGYRVVLEDPDGNRVEVVAEQAPAQAIPLIERPGYNRATRKDRVRQVKRSNPGPATVVRLGHVVLDVSDYPTSRDWYQSLFGFLISDVIEVTAGLEIGAFMRLDRGDEPTDHHALFLMQGERGARFNHAAFEVLDTDDVMKGHAHLMANKNDHGGESAWGVGRHIVGSQIFDYWRDPWGHEIEHWTDGDLFTSDDAPGAATLHDLIGVQWGPEHPMMEHLRQMDAAQDQMREDAGS